MNTLMLLLALAAGATVQMKDDAFGPASITVPVNTPVTFVNRDDDAHTVTATDDWACEKWLPTALSLDDLVGREEFRRARRALFFFCGRVE